MALENVISGTPAVETQPPAAAAPDTSAARIAALEEQVAESKRTSEFWYNNRQQAAPAAVAAVAEPEPEEEVDMLDLLSTQGTKGFDAFMAKRGYVKQSQLDATVNNKANQLSAEAELIENYPDLRKRDSEFFKQTALNYGELKRQGVPDALAMKLGAQQAQLEGFTSGKTKTASTVTADKEAARVARVKAQSGGGSNRATATAEEDDDEMTAQQLHMCEQMGITPEAYIKRAKDGVRMSGSGNKGGK